MIDFSSTIGWIIGGAAVIGTSVAAINAFRKTKPETTGLLVDAAADVVVIQKGAIDDLRKDRDDLREIVNQLRERQTELERTQAHVIQELEDKITSLEAQVSGLHDENVQLKRTVESQRKRIKTLEQNGN